MDLLLIHMVYQMAGILLSPLFWLVVLFVFWQARRSAKMKQSFFQVPQEKVLKKTAYNMFCGFIGGVVASAFVMLLGISIEEIGLEFLWLVVLLLLLVRQRFMCFAYAGGIIAVSNYLFGWPHINIAQLMALVAVLHMVEALLILLSGRQNAMPVYVKGRDGEIAGGFFIQIFWPLPLIMLLPLLVHPLVPVPADVLAMPDWWPLLKPSGELAPGQNVIYELLPVLAALGYSDLVLTGSVKEKVVHSSWQLFFYSILLLALALAGDHFPGLLILPALFAPLGHEWLIQQERKREFAGTYCYRSPEDGVMVLDVLAESPACRAGLQTGDVIIRLAGEPVHGRQDFLQKQQLLPDCIKLTLLRNEEMISMMLRKKRTGEALGIITAPSGKYGSYWQFEKDGGLAKILYKKLANRLKKR